MIRWSASPGLVDLGPLHIRWYGLCFAIAFFLGHVILSWMLRRESLDETNADRIVTYGAIGTVVGARLGHTLFYEPDIYLADPIRILKIWEGGLASHGAAIGILLALYLLSRRHPFMKYQSMLDHTCVPVALGGALIRLGNLFNSEIIGRPTDLPWAFVFTHVDEVPRHPTQVYESLFYFLTFGILMYCYARLNLQRRRGFLFGLFLILIFGFRFVIEFLKEYQVAFEQQMTLDMGQLLSIPLIIGGLILLIRSMSSRSSESTQ